MGSAIKPPQNVAVVVKAISFKLGGHTLILMHEHDWVEGIGDVSCHGFSILTMKGNSAHFRWEYLLTLYRLFLYLKRMGLPNGLC